MTGTGENAQPLVAAYATALGDDALVLAQRLLEWITRAPELEEEVAIANIALDLVGQSRALFTYAGSFDGRDEDDLAYRRPPDEFRCVHLVERPIGDFGVTVARQLLFSTYQCALYEALTASADATLAGIAGKAVKEVAYHRDHAAAWTRRLGDGTELSHQRMQLGLDAMWPYTAELFDLDPVVSDLLPAGVAVDPTTLRPAFDGFLDKLLPEAKLRRPSTARAAGGGRAGVRTADFEALLREMTEVHRSHPGASW